MTRIDFAHQDAESWLDVQSLAFLHESNAIEGIVCLDYRLSRPGRVQGHVAAYLHSQRLARSRKPMSALDLCFWQQLIVLEQRQAQIEIPPLAVGRFRSGFAPFNVGVGSYVPPSFARVPDLMHEWMRDLRNHLVDEVDQPGLPQLADWCGDLLQRFQAIHPFVDGNGRVGRLVVNYLLTYWHHRTVVFKLSDRDEIFAAHQSKIKMRAFLRRLFGT